MSSQERDKQGSPRLPLARAGQSTRLLDEIREYFDGRAEDGDEPPPMKGCEAERFEGRCPKPAEQP